MILASMYIAICIASIGGVVILGAPDWQALAVIAALSVAIIGVPHGGLDHWCGRRLLSRRFSNRWWMVFFGLYFAVAIGFAAAWIAFPILTVLVFFVASAWHFGREDEKEEHEAKSFTLSINCLQEAISHLRSLAVGGLVIWIPSVLRSDEMCHLISLVIPTSETADAQQIVQWAQWFSLFLVPIAAVFVAKTLLKAPGEVVHWGPIATSAISALTPILLSFTIYFCAWHSLQGLRKLQRQERLSNLQFAKATLPLSISAIAGTAMIGWFLHDPTMAIASGERSPVLQTLFIGLSAIAVPHLLLHEFGDSVSRSQSTHNLQPSKQLTDAHSLQKGIVT